MNRKEAHIYLDCFVEISLVLVILPLIGTVGVRLQGLVMLVIEEHSDRRILLSPRARLYLGQGVGPGVIRGLSRVAVDVNVPAQVVGRGQDHDTGVVHPLARLPLSRGQVSQVLLSS